MKQMQKTAMLVTCGCWGYPLLELAWRGWTHWSMALAGGICLGIVGRIGDAMRQRHLLVRCAAGSAAITGVEFLFGCVFNLGLGMQVWDYSAEAGNIAGQICPRYAFLWFLLCMPLFKLAGYLPTPADQPRPVAALPL